VDAARCLSDFSGLRTLPPTTVEDLAAAFVEYWFDDGAELIRFGEQGTHAFLVLDGELSVSIEIDGEETELARLGRGALVGHVSLFDGSPASATVRVVGGARLGVLAGQGFALLAGIRGDIGHAFQRAIGKQGAVDYRRSVGACTGPQTA
jgi:CRP-like cAMP-binding protein